MRRGLPRLRARLEARWTAILLAALLAFSWQSFVTQTHVHPAGDLPVAAGDLPVAAGKAAVQPGQGRSAPDQPANCPICQEIAHAGVYLAPGPVVLHLPEPAAFWPVTTPSPALAVRQDSHDWRSRAPPRPLQA